MSSKTTVHPPKETRQAVYYYPENQCFKVDNETKPQIGTPELLFIEQYEGHFNSFYEYFTKKLEEVGDAAFNNVKITVFYLQELVKNHSLFNLVVIF